MRGSLNCFDAIDLEEVGNGGVFAVTGHLSVRVQLCELSDQFLDLQRQPPWMMHSVVSGADRAETPHAPPAEGSTGGTNAGRWDYDERAIAIEMPKSDPFITATPVTNLLAALMWLAACAITWLSNLSSLAFGGGDLRTLVCVPIFALAALLWLLLSVDALLRPGVLRSGRWFMIGIAIAMLAMGWALWLRDAPCLGAVATTMTCAALAANSWTVAQTARRSSDDSDIKR